MNACLYTVTAQKVSDIGITGCDTTRNVNGQLQ